MKYYGKNDISTIEFHKFTEGYLKNFSENNVNSINDILVLYNIKKYLDDLDKNSELKNKIQIKNILGSKLGKLNFDEIDYYKIEKYYITDFWEIFALYGLIKKVTVDNFKNYIKKYSIPISVLIIHKKIVDRYSSLIKLELLKDPRNFELYIRSLSEQSIIMPQNFKVQEINEWAKRYCESETPNINYLEFIMNWNNKYELKISPKIRMLAGKKYEEHIKVVFSEGNSSDFSFSVNFSDKIDSLIWIENDKNNFKIQFNMQLFKYLSKDNERILCLLFDFFSMFSSKSQYLILPSKTDGTVLIDAVTPSYKNYYKINPIQKFMKDFHKLILMFKIDFLEMENLNFIKVFKYYFEELVPKKYLGIKFKFEIDEEIPNYKTKCKATLPELDSIAHQYKILFEEKELDLELLKYTNDSIDYRQLKAFNDKKFAYVYSNELQTMLNILFSKQKFYVLIREREYMPLYEHIQLGIRLIDLREHQRKYIDMLQEKGIVVINFDGTVQFSNIELIRILLDLYTYEYIVCENYNTDLLQVLSKDDDIRFDDHLLSRQEKEYISFVFDDKEFVNTLAFRNKYIHGKIISLSEHEHKDNYLEIILVLMLLLKRMDEEIQYAVKNKLLKVSS